jgi:hypothetical protein
MGFLRKSDIGPRPAEISARNGRIIPSSDFGGQQRSCERCKLDVTGGSATRNVLAGRDGSHGFYYIDRRFELRIAAVPKFLDVPWGLRPRRTEPELALSLPFMLPSAHINRVGVRVVSFRGSIPTPPILYLRFAGSLAVAAQDLRPSGSLLLSCNASSSSASCRFTPAH